MAYLEKVKNMKLSIVVPIYKVEPYLCKCVDSLLEQDLSKKDYEIILVDDGSPDRCGDICDEYASKYGNIRVVHRENGGLSAARNSGIEVAQGKYIQFVDSDDYLEPNVLKTLVEKMDADNLDILRFNYQNVNENYEVFEPNKVSKPFVDYRDEVCDGLTFLNERMGFACYAWQFMLTRDLLSDRRFYFKEGIHFEDMEWTPRILLQARRVTSVSLMVYDYYVRVGSITKSTDKAKKQKSLHDRMDLLDAMQQQEKELEDNRWFKGMIAQIVVSIIGTIANEFYLERKSYLESLKKKHLFPLSYAYLTKYAKRKAVLINFSPSFACWLMHGVKRK